MTMNSTIYVRFSNQEQAQGTSRERQLRLCREMAARHGWAHDTSDEIIDEGRSAFTGMNRTEGSGLWTFESEVRSGRYRNGHVLIVENLDRISRQGYDAILPFLSDMTSNGVTVATVDGDRIYRAYERVELGPVIEAVVKAELAREESEKKSRRLRAAQQRKVEQAQEYASQGLHIATTKIVPAWIDVDPHTFAMMLNEPRTAILSEIFQLTIDGYGTPAIAKILNQRGEPVWNNRGRRSNNGWTVGYLTKLVTNRAVLGEARPMNRPRHGKPTSKDIVILNRYPQAIDPVIFARAQAARQSRKNTSGAWQITHGNLFSGIAKCAECGGRMKQEVTVRAGWLRRHKVGALAYPARQSTSYLKCHNALNRVTDEESGKRKCTNTAYVRYETLERGVLKVALHFAASRPGSSSQEVTSLEVEVAEALRYVDEKQRQVDNLVGSFSRTGSPSVERAMLALEAELTELRKAQVVRQSELQDALASKPAPDHLESVARLQEELESEDGETRAHARVRMKQTLRGILTSMMCAHTKETTVVLGANAVAMTFDGKGNVVANRILQQRIFGPDGELDWYPDQPDSEAA